MHLRIFLVQFLEMHIRIGLRLKFGRFCEFCGFVLTCSLSMCRFITHMQWLITMLEITLAELGWDTCPKPCRYNVKWKQIGPQVNDNSFDGSQPLSSQCLVSTSRSCLSQASTSRRHESSNDVADPEVPKALEGHE